MNLSPFTFLPSDRSHAFAGMGLVALTLAALTGCTTYIAEGPPPPPLVAYEPPEYVPMQPEGVAEPAPVVVITAESDFYRPLESYGTWIEVDGYGRCWRPRNVGREWRPYTEGHWVSTDAGWCWQSSESFGWATYHYGRWNEDPDLGWYWVPQTEWAPAWVSWREGGGYCGWAPLPPRARAGIEVEVTIAPRAYVFVDEHHFTEPVRPTTVIVNNTTIINKTVIITNTHVTNNVTINAGPRRADVERITGRSIRPVAVVQVRATEDARSGLHTQPLPRQAPVAANPPRAAQPPRPAQPSGARETENRPAPVPAASADKAGLDDKARADLAARSHAEMRAKAEADDKARSEQAAKAQANAEVRARVDARAATDEQARAAVNAKAKAEAEAKSRSVPPPVENRAARVAVDAKAAAEAKADAKKKADAEKARLEQEKRAEDTKPQQ